jgi:hypothetical protein
MSTLRQRAINGDVAAINDLIYAQLGGQGLLVTVQKDAARCLTIRLQGEAVPDPTVYQDYIIDGLQQLRPLDIQSIRVVGEAFDPAVSPETPWEARVPIAKPRRSLRHQLQNPRSSAPSGQGADSVQCWQANRQRAIAKLGAIFISIAPSSPVSGPPVSIKPI